MIINLSDPFTAALAATIIGTLVAAAILGAYRNSATRIELNLTNKKLSNILSEIDSLHKEHEKKISNIKKVDGEIIQHLLEQYDKKVKEIYEANKPSLSIYGALRPSKK